jgi:hypothetical protein
MVLRYFVIAVGILFAYDMRGVVDLDTLLTNMQNAKEGAAVEPVITPAENPEETPEEAKATTGPILPGAPKDLNEPKDLTTPKNIEEPKLPGVP